MSRFRNLEVGSPPAAAPPPAAADSLAGARDGGDYLRQADAAFGRGRCELAMRYYSRVLEFDPNQVAGWVGQIRVLLDQGELAEAATWSAKALQLFPEHPDALAVRALAMLRTGDRAAALGYADAAIAARGAGWLPWLARAEVLMAGGADGSHCFAKAQELAPADRRAAVAVAVARVHLHHGRIAEAIAWATRAVQASADAAYAWAVLGQCHERGGLADAARRDYGQALALDRDCEAAAAGLHRIVHRGWWRRFADAARGMLR